jgi:hypothetical protein
MVEPVGLLHMRPMPHVMEHLHRDGGVTSPLRLHPSHQRLHGQIDHLSPYCYY